MRLTAYNPSTENLEKTYLSQAYAAGVSSLLVKNSDNVSANDRILLGEMGREKSEIVTVSSVNADKVTITLTAATKFPHSSDDSVYVLRYDVIRFYRSTTGIDGTYDFLVSVPVDVDNLKKVTYYNDNVGLPSYYYEVSYYHSVAAIESALSDPIPGEGYAREQVGTILNDFLEEVDDLEQNYVSIPKALSWMNEVNDDLFTQSRKPYRFLRDTWNLSTTADTNRIPLPTDLKYIDFIKYQNDDLGTTVESQVHLMPLEYLNAYTETNYALYDTSDTLQFAAIDETTNELVLYPGSTTTQADAFTIYGWAGFNQFRDLSDTIQTPTPRIYKLFLLARFWLKRSTKEGAFRAQADRYMQDYNTEIVKLQRSNRVDLGSLRGMVPDNRYSRNFYGHEQR